VDELGQRARGSSADFDRYVAEHGIPEEDYPAAFALWLAEVTGGPVPRFEKVEREEPADVVVLEGAATSERASLSYSTPETEPLRLVVGGMLGRSS
jgi:hypothetical protein